MHLIASNLFNNMLPVRATYVRSGFVLNVEDVNTNTNKYERPLWLPLSLYP